jgi:DNA-directed RNA polymerase specialized sigma24 family protein
MNQEPYKHHPFVSTHWSVVIRAGGPNSDEARQSFGALFETYWYPLYAFSRRSGLSDQDAMDSTQSFFTHLLYTEGLDTLTPQKGRFRSFLIASFKNFLANERRAANAQRRGGAVKTISLSGVDFHSRYQNEPAHEGSAERLFDRAWVESLFERVQFRLADDYRLAEKEVLFRLLRPHLTNRGDALPRAEISRQLNLSKAAVAMSLHRMRRRFGELLREEIAATVDDPTDIEEELRELMTLVSQPDG